MAGRTGKGNSGTGPVGGGIGNDPAADASTARRMPESLAAEAAVLGSMIIDPQCIGRVVEILGRDAFYRVEHQMIFDALVDLFQTKKGTVIDGVLLRDQLEKRKQMETVGGVEYLQRVVESVPSAGSVEYYAGIVKEKALLRELIVAAGEILEEAYSPVGEADEKLDEAEKKIFAVADKRITSAAVSIKDIVSQAYELIEKREGTHVTGLSTGFDELNELTCGLQKGEMVIVAGRPSMGKTAFVLNIAEHLGVDERAPVAFFSLEMGKQQLAERLLCSRSGVKADLVRKGMLGDDHYRRLLEACSAYYEAPIYIDDTPAISPLELRAKARRLKHQFAIQCVIVDYLQLMHGGMSRVESRQQEITAISRHVKALARELEVPIVMLSQLNRAAEGREGHRPRMSDLRESGSLEQDADVVILLHREDYYHQGEESYEEDNIAEVIVAKQRNGPTGLVKLLFQRENAKFLPLSHVPEESVPF